MAHFLLVFDRSEGRLLRDEEFGDGKEALRERLRAEKLHRGLDVEVVVLTADSREALQHTHGRYYRTLGELAVDRDGAKKHAARSATS